MEHLHPTSFPESLKATLNCYKITSIDSLSGPSGYPALAAQMWFKENKQLPPIPPQPMLQIPYFIPNDRTAERSETVLAGEKIACFIVGGEKRLCLPQILTSVLREYSIAEINQACAELHIYCSRCLPEHLEYLKALSILPINTAQCGLITKTDAERLVALLSETHEPLQKDRIPKDIDLESGFPVYHECFGRGFGKFYPKAYVSPVARCIVCEDCGCLYSPQRFITHSDRSFEKRTCHWGFDPENWRNYLLLPKNMEGVKREEFQKILDQMKARFAKPRHELTGPHTPIRYSRSPPTPTKRRFDNEQESPSRKKVKDEDGKLFEPSFFPPQYTSLPYGVPSVMRHSTIYPWTPGLSTMNHSDMPVIQDLTPLKGLIPFNLERGGFPQYIQASRPVVFRNRAPEFTIPPPTETRAVSGVRPPLSCERRQSNERQKVEAANTIKKSPARNGGADEKDKNNNHDPVPAHSVSQHFPKRDLTRSHSFERQRNRSVSPPSRNIAAISPRARGRQSPARHPTTSQLPRPTALQISNNNNALREPQELEISRPVSRSREAAATAMLELKSAWLYRSMAPPLTTHAATTPLSSTASETPRKLISAPTSPRSTPCVVPLNSSRQHYKWTIGEHSYIVSAAGVQSLEMLQCIVMNDCGSEAGKGRLMHELVKMKSIFEEKIDLEMRMRRDLETELEHLKTSKRQNVTSKAKQLIKQDIQSFRQEHIRRTEELHQREESLRKTRQGCSQDENEESSAERDIHNLRSRVHELEATNDKLRLSLVEERGKREDVELKLEELEEHSRGRIPYLVESPLSRMVRGVVHRTTEEEKPLPRIIVSPCNKKTSSTQVPAFPATSTVTSVPHRQLNGILPRTPASLSQLPREQSHPSDAEIHKTIVVT